MDPIKGKILPIAPQPSYRTTIIAMLVVVVQVVVSLVTYPLLPESVPSHWNVTGQVDGYASKLFIAILWPLISAVVYGMLSLLIAISPGLSIQRQRQTQAIVKLLILVIILFLLVVQVMTTAISLGFHIDINFVMNIALSILFIFIGNYLGKLRRNYWAGIKTPWTIASDVVWERTHRFASWLYVCAGLLGIAVTFIPFTRVWGVIVLIMLASVLSIIYSYVVYKNVGT